MRDFRIASRWLTLTIGDVGEVFDGPHATPTTVDSGPLFLGISSIVEGRIELGKTRHVTEADFLTWTRRVKPKAGDVVFSYETRLGQIAKIPVGMRCCLGRRMGLVRLDQTKVIPDFFVLAYISPGYQEFLRSRVVQGATVDRLLLKDFKNFPFPLPPLEEQHQIVAVLDEAFEGLARARAHAEANLRDALELLANTIDSLMVSDGTAAEFRLGDLCTFENGDRGKNYPGRKAFVPTGVPFINAGHLLNGPIDWANMNFIPLAHFNRLSNGKVRPGDLLFCLRGSLGKFGTVDSAEPGAIASSLVIVRPKDRLLPEYLAAYFESTRCAEMIESYGNGAAQPNLSAKSLAAFTIALPDLEAQSQVVSAVAEIRQSADQLCRAYETKLEDIDALRQSLLQKAFAGELT